MIVPDQTGRVSSRASSTKTRIETILAQSQMIYDYATSRASSTKTRIETLVLSAADDLQVRYIKSKFHENKD